MTNKHEINIGCCNVTTCKDDVKLVQCAIAVKKLGQPMCFLTETHRTEQGEIDQWPADAGLDGWRFIYSGLKKKAAAGVGILLGDQVEMLDHHPVLDGRILYARIKISGVQFNVWCVYAPTNTQSDEMKMAFFSALSKSVREKQAKYPSWKTLIAGDWNSTLGPDCPKMEWVGNNHQGEYPTTDMGYKMADWLQEHSLYALNTLFQTKPQHRITWKLGRTAKRLDYIVGDKFIRICTRHIRAYPAQSEAFETNHRLLVCHLRVPSRAQRTVMFRKVAPRPRPVLSTLRNDSTIRRQYSKELEQELSSLETADGLDAEELDRRITAAIKEATARTVPVAQKTEEPWVTPDFRQLVEQVASEKDRKLRRRLAKKMRRTREQLKSRFYKERALAINAAGENRKVEEEYRLLREKKMLRNSGRTACPADRLYNHFKQHFSTRPLPAAPELMDLPNHPYLQPDKDTPPVSTSTPTLDEVTKACIELKNNRCMGSDGIAGEQIKYADSPNLQRHIHALILRVWEELDCPDGWKSSRLKPLWKSKGSPTDCTKYRGLMINPTLNKVIIMILLARLREHYEHSILPSQWGFRTGRSTTDGIFVARQLTTKTAEPIWGCFVDLRAAYDHLHRGTLWKMMRTRLGKETGKIVDILECMYEDTQAVLDGKPDPLPVKVGVRQGGAESCVIFNYALDFVLRIALHKIEAQFPGSGITHRYDISNECTDRQQRAEHAAQGIVTTTIITYADDILLLGRSKQEIQGMMQILYETFLDYGLTMAGDKTVTMTWNTSEETQACESLIEVGGEKLSNVRQFRYLGHMLVDNAKKPKYITHQISSAWAKWNEIKGVLTDREIALWIRVRMLETMVRSRLVYAVQSERLSAAERKTLDSIWINFCRKLIKGGYRKKKTQNEDGEDIDTFAFVYNGDEVLKICRTSSLSEFCQRQHIKYIAHIARMPNNSELKQWLFTKDEHKYVQNPWKVLGRDLGMDEIQVRRMLFRREELNAWLRSHESR